MSTAAPRKTTPIPALESLPPKPAKNPVQIAKSPNARFRIYTRPRTYATVLKAILTGTITKGDDVERLEAALAKRFEVQHAVATPQARVAIYLAIKHTLKPGKNQVIVSPYTIFDVINMVIAAGAEPVFADVDRTTTNIDPETIAPLITDKTAAVMVTHLHGCAVDMTRVREICDPRGIPVIEDTAQAFGGKWKGKPLGGLGHAGVVSFGMYKNITGFYGGCLLTNDAALAQAARSELASYPFTETAHLLKRVREGFTADIATWPPLFKAIAFKIFRLGSLYDIQALNQRVDPERDPTLREQLPEKYRRRITPLQARLVLQGLPYIDAEAYSRLAMAQIYADELKGVKGLIQPAMRDDLSHLYQYYPVQVANRAEVIKRLLRRGRDLAPQHIKNTADLPCFARWKRECPQSRAMAQEVILLPTYPRYGGDQAMATARALREVLAEMNG